MYASELETVNLSELENPPNEIGMVEEYSNLFGRRKAAKALGLRGAEARKYRRELRAADTGLSGAEKRALARERRDRWKAVKRGEGLTEEEILMEQEGLTDEDMAVETALYEGELDQRGMGAGLGAGISNKTLMLAGLGLGALILVVLVIKR
jgi:hypothetical protein